MFACKSTSRGHVLFCITRCTEIPSAIKMASLSSPGWQRLICIVATWHCSRLWCCPVIASCVSFALVLAFSHVVALFLIGTTVCFSSRGLTMAGISFLVLSRRNSERPNPAVLLAMVALPFLSSPPFSMKLCWQTFLYSLYLCVSSFACFSLEIELVFTFLQAKKNGW